MRSYPSKHNENLTFYEFDSEEEWLAFRKDHIGASDASIIMGTSKWKTNDGRIKTPRLLWQEKLGLDSMDCDNSATRYGKAMEEPARNAYQEMVGDLFTPICVKNKKYPYFMVSLDGLNVTEDRAVEIKNCNEDDHLLAKDGKVPAKYYPQVQMQSMVTELPYVDYFSFHKGEGVIVKVDRDDEYISEMSKKLDRFWEYFENLKEPPLTEDDFIEKGSDWYKKAEELYEVQQIKKKVTEEERKLKNELKNLSDNRNAYSGDFRYVCSTSLGAIDYNSIPELLNVELSDYRKKPIEKWFLRKAN